MARRRKPDNETTEESITRQQLETISDFATRNEKVSWDRKMNNMVSLLSQLTPIEEAILELTAKKNPILDQIAALRTVMVEECVHPYTHLVHKVTHAECKFCNKRISLPSVDSQSDE